MPSKLASPVNHVMTTRENPDGTQSKICILCQLAVLVGDVSLMELEHPYHAQCPSGPPTLEQYVDVVLDGARDLIFYVNGRLVEYKAGELYYPSGGQMVKRQLLLHDTVSIIGRIQSNPLFLFAGRSRLAQDRSRRGLPRSYR